MNAISTVRDRIFAAADLLFKQSGCTSFPTVDAVRKQAKVNMNDAATGMREWRRTQTVQVAQADSVMPTALHGSCVKALEGLWTEATAIANEALRAAQAGWEAERGENDTLREQIATAFEEQTKELEQANSTILSLQDELHEMRENLDRAKLELQAEARQTDRAEQAARQAEAKVSELQRLSTELSAEVAHGRQQLDAMTTNHRENLDYVRNELRVERDAQNVEQQRLRGLVENLQAQLQQALQDQVSRLSAALNNTPPAKGPARAKSKALSRTRGNGEDSKRRP